MDSDHFKNMDVVSITDFSLEEIEHILAVAKDMLPYAKGERTSDILKSKILATLFFEPSTRTRLSFECAMHRLGGSVLGFSEPGKTSIAKGETLADTIRMAEAYSDIITIRHPNEGSARLAAEFSDKPVLNAGDGAGQHPTQTLLDLYTIKDEKGSIDGQKVTFVGDLRYGRTVHSLAHALTMYKPKMAFVAPRSLQMPSEIINDLARKGVEPNISQDLDSEIEDTDVLYVTRVQKERFPDPGEYAKVANIYKVDLELLNKAKKDLSVMHPLPRVTEIATEVDATPHAVYFRQAFNGVLVRMALLKLLLGGGQ